MASISDYKKQHPEYRNIPDLQLAEIMYEKAYKGKISETEFYKLAFPNISDERVEEDIPQEGLDYLEGRGILLPKDDFFKPTTSEIAKSAGVSVNDPADIKARFGGSLGYNEEQKALAIKNSLSKIYKQDIDVRTGPQTGELEYFNPKTQSYALVDKPGMDFGDFGDIGGDALVIGADIAATIAGTIFTTPVGGLTTGAIAAGAAEYYRLKWGQEHYGVNLDLTDNELLHEAFKTFGISAGAGFLGLGGIKLIKSINNVVKGRAFSSVDEGVESLKSAKALEAEKVAKDINIKLEDAGIKARVKWTLAEATDDKDLLSIQSAFEEKRVLGKVGEFREFGEAQAVGLNKYFGLMKEKFGVNAGSTYDTGKLISEVTENRNKDAVKNLIKKQKASDELLTKKVFNLPDGSSKVTGVEFRSIVKDLGDAYKSDAKLAAKELDKVSGLKLIDTDEIAKAVTKLSAKEQKSLIEVAKIEGIFKPGVYGDLLSKNSKMLLSDARETMSVLSKKIREKQIGLAAGETPDVGRLMFLKSAFTDQVKKNAGKEYLDELQKFNDLVITNKELLNNDIISKLTKIEIGSILKVADEDIFETTFKKGIGSGKAAAEVYEVISRSPEALNAYKNSIFNKYRSEVLDPITNKPSLVKHNSFIKNYEKPLRTFFNEEAEYNKISRIGGLQRNIEKTNKLFTQTQKELSKSFEGKLFRTSPEEIFKKIYGPGNIGQVKTLKNILQKNPEVFKKFQRDVLTDLNEKVFKLDKKFTLGRVLDADAFNRYLNGGGGEAGHRAVLKEIFGNEYVKNLDTLNQALQIANRSAATAQQGVVASAFTDIIRARVGQFTVAGRLLTAFRRIFTAASNRVIARALLNPDSLKDLIALKTLPKRSKAAAAILAKLGGSVFMVQDDLPTQPSKETVIEQDIETTDDQVSSLLNEGEGADDGGQMAAMPLVDTPSLVVPNVNPSLFAQAPTGIATLNQGLTPTESAFLREEDKQIRLRQRGLA